MNVKERFTPALEAALPKLAGLVAETAIGQIMDGPRTLDELLVMVATDAKSLPLIDSQDEAHLCALRLAETSLRLFALASDIEETAAGRERIIARLDESEGRAVIDAFDRVVDMAEGRPVTLRGKHGRYRAQPSPWPGYPFLTLCLGRYAYIAYGPCKARRYTGAGPVVPVPNFPSQSPLDEKWAEAEAVRLWNEMRFGEEVAA